jgi:transcriptional regulator with XRE-family HTH domain
LHKRPNARIRIGHYHTLPQSKGNLYQAVRKLLGMSRAQMSGMIGITESQLHYRERAKRMYHPCEVVALHVISGMTPDEFMQLLNDIA